MTELNKSYRWHLAHKQHLGTVVCLSLVHILTFIYKFDNKGDNLVAWVP